MTLIKTFNFSALKFLKKPEVQTTIYLSRKSEENKYSSH